MRKKNLACIVMLAGMFVFLTNNAYAQDGLKVDSTGNVGIGIETPTHKLHLSPSLVDNGIMVDDTAGAGDLLNLRSTVSDSSAHYFMKITSDSDAGAGGPFDIFSIRNDGYIGIGTNEPTEKVEVSGGNLRITGGHLKVSNSNDYSVIQFLNDDTILFNIGTFPADSLRPGSLYFQRFGIGQVAMYIDKNNGNVGIGTVFPNEKVEVAAGNLRITGGNLKISNSNDYSTIQFLNNGAALFHIGTYPAESPEHGSLYFYGWGSSEVAMFIDKDKGNVGIGTTSFGNNAATVLGIGNGTAPTSSPPDMVQLYAVDFDDADGTATSELFVRDEDGNAVDLSPHIFALFNPDRDEPLPWAYYSENNYLGKRINVDMAGAIRAIEQLTGKQFIFYEDIPKVDAEQAKRKGWKQNWIAENTTEIEIAIEDAFETVEAEVDDESKVIDEKVSYELDGEEVKEVREPIYAKKPVPRRQLKGNIRFDTDTGKFFMKIKPTEAEAEAAASQEFQFKAKKWVKARLKNNR